MRGVGARARLRARRTAADGAGPADRRDPGRDGRDRAEPAGIGIRGEPRRVDLDLARGRRERDARSGSRISRAKATASSGAGSRARPAARKASKSSISGPASSRSHCSSVLSLCPRARDGGEVGADVQVVAALAHGRDGLLHVDDVVAAAAPRRVHVVALPEGGGGQHDVGVARGGREEVVVHHHELEPSRAAATVLPILGSWFTRSPQRSRPA